MLLAIDIGNTQTVIGLFKDDILVQSGECLRQGMKLQMRLHQVSSVS